MQPTSTTWKHAGVAVVLALVGVLAARPTPLLGAAGVGAFLLARQYAAYKSFHELDAALSVSVDTLRESAVVDEKVRLTVDVKLDSPVDVPVDVAIELPVSASTNTSGPPTVTLPPGDTSTTHSFTCSFPIAGQFDFPDVSIDLRDPADAFTERLTRPVDAAVTVTPRRPQNVHVGQGGQRVAAAYGEHTTERGGAGLVPQEIRQYVAGDTLDHIDWKATARFGAPHVREFEAQTDRQTILVVDHREAMDVGPAGATMLAYAREVALGYARVTEELGDPLGLYAVGDEGVTTVTTPTTAAQGYRMVREALYDLEPTRAEHVPDAPVDRARPAAARAAGQRLAREDSAFAQTLAPFLTDAGAYLHRVEGDLLFGAVERLRAEVGGDRWTILVTHDSDPTRVREAVRLARRGDDHVLVFLTPRVLFEEGALADTEAAYDRYADFEEFRKELDRLDRVTVFEVGPGDRVDALLAARRGRA